VSSTPSQRSKIGKEQVEGKIGQKSVGKIVKEYVRQKIASGRLRRSFGLSVNSAPVRLSLYSKFINMIVWDNDCVADQMSPVFAKIERADFRCAGYCRIAAPS